MTNSGSRRTQAICVLGRGIERVLTNRGHIWRPTRYIETLSESGAHTGVRADGIDINDNESVIAGAHANVLAACQLCQELDRSGTPPTLIVFAAGRPGYLRAEADLDLTEGRILEQAFRRKMRDQVLEALIFSNNRDTKDDIDHFLKLCGQRNIGKAAIISIRLHLERAKEFAKQSPYYGEATVGFLASEEILERRYKGFVSFARIGEMCVSSAAYGRTAFRERQGLDALRSGIYERST
jgi:hypothetical protein